MLKINKKHTPYLILALIFVLLEIGLGISIQLVDTPETVRVLCYSSVVAAFCFAFLSFQKELGYLFTLLGLFFTLLADLFLVLPETPNQLPGMCFFICVQLLYGAKLYLLQKSKKAKLVHIILRAVLSLIGAILTFIVLGESVNAVAVISVIYYANLVLNIVLSFLLKKRIFGIGLVLFACCDALIGLDVLANGIFEFPEGSFLHTLLNPGFNAVWAFYTPSQTLLSLSLLPDKLKSI